MNNSSLCDGFVPTIVIVLSSANSISVCVCLLAAILACALKLCKKTVYRLALYQVLASLLYAGQAVCQIFLIYYHSSVSYNETVKVFCRALAFTLVFSSWMKVCLSAWVTYHIFLLAVLHKNMKRLEALYIVSSLVVSALIASVPFTTHSYGLQGSNCWIQSWGDNCPSNIVITGVIEQFALTYGPSMAILLVVSTAMVVMVIIVLRRMYFHRGQNWKALQQLLPLAIYPVLFFVFTIPPFVNRLYGTRPNVPHSTAYALSIMGAVTVASWSFFTGLSLIVHIFVASLHAYRKRRPRAYQHLHSRAYGSMNSEEGVTVKPESTTSGTSRTTFHPPTESVVMTSTS